VRHALVDGEAAMLLPDGTTRSQALQNRSSASEPGELDYFVFDLLHLDGYDLRPLPLEERKRLLRQLLSDSGAGTGVVRYSDHVLGQGARFLESACARGLDPARRRARAARRSARRAARRSRPR
jgi:bifunctional non-homologous end joining protein LigD